MATKALFRPIKIGKNQLEHRVVMAPLTRARATLEGVPTDGVVEYYSQRASPGGLMISEATFIDRLAGGYRHVPGIYREDQIKAWQQVTDAVHAKGGYLFMQLWHVGRVGSRDLNPNGEQVVSASDIPARGKNYLLGGDHEPPRALTVTEIEAWIERYRQAALNAIEAGFDGVEIHSSHGYLLDQFINSSSNRRTDAYGGPIPNRTRFPLQVVDAIVDAIGAHRTAIRLTPGADFQDVSDETVVATWSYLVSELQQHHPDLAYLHFVQAHANVMDDTFVDQDSLAPYRTIWKGPIIVAGGYSNATEAAMDYAEKNGCLMSFGRAFVANPDLPQRLLHRWPLNPYDRSTFYTHDLKGYTDYPFYEPLSHHLSSPVIDQ